MNNLRPLISLTHLTKKYAIGNEESTVLNNISLTVNQGEMLAIVGTSGSGKSTLMNLIGLLDKADTGQYLLQSQNIAGLDDNQLAKLRNECFGFVFQQFHLLPRFNTLQNVALPLAYRHLEPAIIKEQVNSALERVGMLSYGAHRPNQLSGGQQQRVAIARALIGEPKVILADEPTGALDSSTGKEIMKLFLALHAEGRTMIIVTHDEHVASQCSRRITIADGQIIGESSQ